MLYYGISSNRWNIFLEYLRVIYFFDYWCYIMEYLKIDWNFFSGISPCYPIFGILMLHCGISSNRLNVVLEYLRVIQFLEYLQIDEIFSWNISVLSPFFYGKFMIFPKVSPWYSTINIKFIIKINFSGFGGCPSTTEAYSPRHSLLHGPDIHSDILLRDVDQMAGSRLPKILYERLVLAGFHYRHGKSLLFKKY